ncbi:hypothetical protein BC941DRAFT_416297 [Chlamydoabsidia padenii]|nr:hypothetical protein BC941DRAFT_416297 [Chlamydoabsidia padenii]
MASEDDIWASSGDEDYDQVIAEKEWLRMQENHGNDGYKEGIIEGKEVCMQKGFDQGYIEGLAIGKELGALRGKLSTYLTFYKQVEPNTTIANQLEALFNELDKVDVQHIFSTTYFDSSKPPPNNDIYVSPQEKINQWQQKINQAIEQHTTVGTSTTY